MIVDTHTHVISKDEDRYPLQCTTSDPDHPSSWPLHARVDAQELAAEMAAAGVERACLVQGFAAYQFDNRYVTAAAEGDPSRFVAVCAVDSQDATSPAALRALAANPRMRGIRIVSGFVEGDPGLGSTGARVLWETANQLGVVVIVFTLADQFETFAAQARSHAAHPVILDHCGFLDLPREFDRLATLAPLDNVHLKVSTRVLLQDDPARILSQLVDVFGADRLLWGSDYPASHERSYRDWVELARASAQNLSPSERDRFLGGTALELWPELR